jgi:hypothetical protein
VTDSSPSPPPDKSLGRALLAVRYVIPAVLLLAGLVSVFVVPSGTAFEAWVLYTSAGPSGLLLNVLFRIGVQGDIERDREGATRAYFDKHGRWPEEEKRSAGRQRKQPEGVVMPESESESARSRRGEGRPGR